MQIMPRRESAGKMVGVERDSHGSWGGNRPQVATPDDDKIGRSYLDSLHVKVLRSPNRDTGYFPISISLLYPHLMTENLNAIFGTFFNLRIHAVHVNHSITFSITKSSKKTTESANSLQQPTKKNATFQSKVRVCRIKTGLYILRRRNA